VAVIVPDVEVIKQWASENKIAGTLSVLCAHPEVKRLIMDDMTLWGKEAGLRSFEQVRFSAVTKLLKSPKISI
jgi:long-chain acyl-CoA synthetase